MIVIVRREPESTGEDLTEPHDKAWFVAEVVSLQPDGDGDASNGDGEGMLSIWEMGNPRGVATTGVNHLYAWKGESKHTYTQRGSHVIRWVPKDMFLSRAGKPPKNKHNRDWAKVILTIPLTSIVDYGPKKDMLTGKNNKVNVAVLNAIDRNTHVLWERPKTKKRKKPASSDSD
jgi:hypothetical protein